MWDPKIVRWEEEGAEEGARAGEYALDGWGGGGETSGFGGSVEGGAFYTVQVDFGGLEGGCTRAPVRFQGEVGGEGGEGWYPASMRLVDSVGEVKLLMYMTRGLMETISVV